LSNPVNYVDPFGLAYFAERPLNIRIGQNFLLGWWLQFLLPNRLGPNWFNYATVHEQLFFEDGLPKGDWGYFDTGLGQDNSNLPYNTPTDTGYNDCIMRKAANNVDATAIFTAANYKIIGFNCQTYAAEVRREYYRLKNGPQSQHQCVVCP
jgi:hypothetical protein